MLNLVSQNKTNRAAAPDIFLCNSPDIDIIAHILYKNSRTCFYCFDIFCVSFNAMFGLTKTMISVVLTSTLISE